MLGGLCFISATKGDGGEVLHLAPPASVTFGERDGDTDSVRTREIAKLFEQAQVDQVCSTRITLALWTKYTFLAALAAGTCLMRAPVGRIVATEGGAEFMRALYRECVAVAAAAGEAIELSAQENSVQILTQTDSTIKASMLRDLEAGQQVEATHIVGDMLHRAAEAGIDTPHLLAASVHLQAYVAQRV